MKLEEGRKEVRDELRVLGIDKRRKKERKEGKKIGRLEGRS